MGVNHCGANVTVAEQFLDGAYVCPSLQQVGCKRVSEGVAVRRLCHPRGHHGSANLFLNDRAIEVVAPLLPTAFPNPAASRWPAPPR